MPARRSIRVIQHFISIEEERIAFTAATLRDLLFMAVAGDTLRLLIFIAVMAANPPGALVAILIKSLFVTLIPYLLWRSGRVRQAAWFMAVAAASFTAVYVLLSGGMGSSMMVVQIAIAIMATTVLGRRGTLGIGVPTMVFLAGVAAFQSRGGRLPNIFILSPWVAYVNCLVAATAAFVLVIRALERLNNAGPERMRTLEALRRSIVKLDDLVNAVDGIVWECDAKTLQFTYVSQKAERLLGYPAKNWLEGATFGPTTCTPTTGRGHWTIARRLLPAVKITVLNIG